MRVSDLRTADEVHRRDRLSVKILVLMGWVPNQVSIWWIKWYLRRHKDQLAQLWYQAEDQALLNSAELQQSLEQYRNGQVTEARTSWEEAWEDDSGTDPSRHEGA